MFKLKGPIISGLILVFFATFVFTRFELYNLIPNIDKMFHVIGGIIVAWYFSRLWRGKLDHFEYAERLVLFMSCVALTGIVWELLEYSTSLPILKNPTLHYYLYSGTLADTLLDIIADLFGAAVFALLYRPRS